jgi:hypothetical protein
LLFKRVNSGFAINNLNIIYIDWYNKAIYRGKRGVLSYKNTIVGLKLLEAKAYKEVVNNFILYIRWLLKTIVSNTWVHLIGLLTDGIDSYLIGIESRGS